jgi:Tol biopolymer transport system component
VVARYCGSGGKPGFSYDDRYVVYHHGIVLTSDEEAQELGFDDVNDPKFQAYVDAGGAQNIWLLDLTTGVRTRITNMKPGQLALFPHFRSDGWIYFLVKDLRSETPNEYVAASNARLLLAD